MSPTTASSPPPAKPTVRLTLEHEGELRFRGTNAQGTSLVLDGSDGDTPAGLRPMEALLAALGACTAIDVVSIMEKKRRPLAHYRLEIIGERAEKHPRRYTRIRVLHHVSGVGIDRESVETAVHLSAATYCSVGASLDAEIVHEVILEQV